MEEEEEGEEEEEEEPERRRRNRRSWLRPPNRQAGAWLKRKRRQDHLGASANGQAWGSRSTIGEGRQGADAVMKPLGAVVGVSPCPCCSVSCVRCWRGWVERRMLSRFCLHNGLSSCRVFSVRTSLAEGRCFHTRAVAIFAIERAVAGMPQPMALSPACETALRLGTRALMEPACTPSTGTPGDASRDRRRPPSWHDGSRPRPCRQEADPHNPAGESLRLEAVTGRREGGSRDARAAGR